MMSYLKLISTRRAAKKLKLIGHRVRSVPDVGDSSRMSSENWDDGGPSGGEDDGWADDDWGEDEGWGEEEEW